MIAIASTASSTHSQDENTITTPTALNSCEENTLGSMGLSPQSDKQANDKYKIDICKSCATDEDFEENLKQFQQRLETISDNAPRSRLVPNL